MAASCRLPDNSSVKSVPSQLDPASARFGQRVELKVPVALTVAGRPSESGVLRNASISGALIETALDLPLHANIVVTFTISDGKEQDVRELNACVVRIDPAGIGVEWRDMGSVDITDLLARASKSGPAD